MTTLEDIKTALGANAKSYSDELLQDAWTAADAAQASMCDLPAQRTAGLDKALARRAQLTLEGSDGKTIARRFGGSDTQVRKLEQPYRKGQAASKDVKPQRTKTSGSRRRRSTPKK